MIGLLLILFLTTSEVAEKTKDTEILYAYISTYEIIKEADAIAIGTVLDIKFTKVGKSTKVKIDTVLKGEVIDTILVFPVLIPEDNKLFFIKRVERKEVSKEIEREREYNIDFPRFLFSHSKPKTEEEKIERVKKYCNIISYTSPDERASELYKWYKETENEGLKYELLEALNLEKSKVSKDVFKSVLLSCPSIRLRGFAVGALGGFYIKDNGIDSLLIVALTDPSGVVRKQALNSLGRRKKIWTIPYIRTHLYDSLCCGEAVEVLSRYASFNTDSLLKVVSKIPCEDACKAALDKIGFGVSRWVGLRLYTDPLDAEWRDSIYSILNPIPWTQELRDSLLSFMYHHRYKQISRSAMSFLGLSKDTTLFSEFLEYIYKLKEELSLLKGDDRKETRRMVGLSIISLGRLGDKRAIPLILDLLTEAIENEPDDRLISFASIISLQNLNAIEVVPELENLKALATDSDIKKRLYSIIKYLIKFR